MLSIPPLPPAGSRSAQGAAPAGDKAAAGAGDAFTDILSQLGLERSSAGETEILAGLLTDALGALRQGMPLEQVLANLQERLKELADGPVPPGLLPLPIDGLVPREVAAETLLTRPGGREADFAKAAAAQVTPGLPAAAPEQALELKAVGLADGVMTQAATGNDKLSLATPIKAMEAGMATPSTLNPAQAVPLKGLELLPSFSSMFDPLAGAKGADEPLMVPHRVGEPGWGQAMAQRVLWMIGREQQTAELKLNPAHLGPVEVKLTLQHDQASVSLLASNSAVKEALEQALPRLRDMLGQQDIQLVQVDVGQRQDPRNGTADGNPGGQQGASAQSHPQAAADSDESGHTGQVIRRATGLLDAYA